MSKARRWSAKYRWRKRDLSSTEGGQPENSPDDDEWFETASLEDEKASQDATCYRYKAVERYDSSSGLDTLVEGDDQDRVQVICLTGPRCET